VAVSIRGYHPIVWLHICCSAMHNMQVVAVRVGLFPGFEVCRTVVRIALALSRLVSVHTLCLCVLYCYGPPMSSVPLFFTCSTLRLPHMMLLPSVTIWVCKLHDAASKHWG
jgi:hypothetical protein